VPQQLHAMFLLSRYRPHPLHTTPRKKTSHHVNSNGKGWHPPGHMLRLYYFFNKAQSMMVSIVSGQGNTLRVWVRGLRLLTHRNNSGEEVHTPMNAALGELLLPTA